VTYQPGTRAEYVAAVEFDLITDIGDVGVETREVDGWVYAEWPFGGEHGEPGENVRPHVKDTFRADVPILLTSDSRGASMPVCRST
jgi:hypothetical protein